MATFREDNVLAAATRTNSTLTAPAGLANNDILLIALDIEADVTPTPPAGFAQLINIDHSGATLDLFVWWKRAASESGDYTVTHGSAWTNGYIVAVQAASTSVDPVAGTGNQGTGTTATALDVTPIGDNALIGFFVNTLADMGAITPPTGSTPTFTERYDSTNNLYAATGTLAVAGATGNKAITIASTNWSAVMIVVEDTATSPPDLTGFVDLESADEVLLESGDTLVLEAGPPLGPIEGQAVASFGYTATASGIPRTSGVATATFGYTATAAGHIIERGAAVAAFAGTFTAAGVDRALGAAVATFGGTFTASGVAGTPPVQGQAVASFGFTATATGLRRRPGVATASFGYTATASGAPRTQGTAVAAFGFTATASGRPRHVGLAAATFGYTATASGIRRPRGQAVATFGFTAEASGFAGTPPVTGVAVATFGFTATSSGVDRAIGAAVATFGYTATGAGRPRKSGTATASFGYTTTALGVDRAIGQATASFGYTAAVFIITYRLTVTAAATPRYTATPGGNRHTALTGGPRYVTED